MAGMGIRNIWTYLNATPIGQQKKYDLKQQRLRSGYQSILH